MSSVTLSSGQTNASSSSQVETSSKAVDMDRTSEKEQPSLNGGDDGDAHSFTSEDTLAVAKDHNSGPPQDFRATVDLQIETTGLGCLSLTSPLITQIVVPGPQRHIYTSIRPSRMSGSCTLVRADDASSTPAPLTTTTYRFGPYRPPRVRIMGVLAADLMAEKKKGGGEGGEEEEEEFEIKSTGWFHRTQRMETKLGTFEWRYAHGKEKKAAAADNLLVLERIEVPGAGAAGEKSDGSQSRRRVAQLVRNAEYRTPGSSRSSAGNGGRLMMDLEGLNEQVAERLQVLIVTTVLVMLKKEVDNSQGATFAAVS